jgi:hypothetical protein
MRKEIGRHWGDETYPHREAIIYFNVDEAYWEVEFWDKKQLIETRPMVTDGVAHSEVYAENAAENWCLGYIP